MSLPYRNFQSQKELDAAYDVENSVTDFMLYANQYISGSEQARTHLKCHLNISYGPTVDEYVDVFPAARANAQVLVFFHGGYWKSLSAKEFSFVASGLVSAGITVVVANYSLCPQVSIDEIVRQSRSVIAWTHRNIARFNGDPEAVYLSGHSAGAHLGAMCMLTDWSEYYALPNNVLKGGVLISGLYDLEPLKDTFLQPDLQLTDEQIKRNSPSHKVRKGLPKAMISWGSDESEEFSRQSSDFLKAWTKKGNVASFLAQPGRNHFTSISEFAADNSEFCKNILEFMSHSGINLSRTPNASERRYGVSPWPSRVKSNV